MDNRYMKHLSVLTSDMIIAIGFRLLFYLLLFSQLVMNILFVYAYHSVVLGIVEQAEGKNPSEEEESDKSRSEVNDDDEDDEVHVFCDL